MSRLPPVPTRRDCELVPAVSVRRRNLCKTDELDAMRANVVRAEPIGLDDLVEERRQLAASSGNIFATPEFLETWWRHFGGGHRLALHVVCDEDGHLRGVLPLYRWSPGVLRFIGHGGGDELGPVALDADRELVAAAHRDLNGAVTVCEHLTPEWADLLCVQRVVVEPTPVIRLTEWEGWEAFLDGRSSKLRYQIRSRWRRLEENHEAVFRLADEATLEDDLDHLFRLHRTRWNRATEFEARHPFHRDFARVALRQGWTRLIVLELDGAAVATWYGFRFGPFDSHYQAGRDRSLDKQSIGLLLLSHTIRSAFEAKQHEYRFLRGDESYKFRFSDDVAYVTSGVSGAGAKPIALTLQTARQARQRLRSLRRGRERGEKGQRT
jgi:CelD/BcsL family acetyltransferase involved in cellulose biosynthesis